MNVIIANYLHSVYCFSFFYFPLKISLISESTSFANTPQHSTGLSVSGRCELVRLNTSLTFSQVFHRLNTSFTILKI